MKNCTSLKIWMFFFSLFKCIFGFILNNDHSLTFLSFTHFSVRILCRWLEENRKFDLTLTRSDFHVVFMDTSLFVCWIHSFWWNAYWWIFFNGYCFEYMISTLWELLWLNLHRIIKESPLKSTVTVQEFFKEILEQELDTTAWNSVDTLPFSKPCKPFHQYKPHSLNNDL